LTPGAANGSCATVSILLRMSIAVFVGMRLSTRMDCLLYSIWYTGQC
jgi:hypothetical protein